MDKRQLGSFLRSRRENTRFQEVHLRVLVHNLAILWWIGRVSTELTVF